MGVSLVGPTTRWTRGEVGRTKLMIRMEPCIVMDKKPPDRMRLYKSTAAKIHSIKTQLIHDKQRPQPRMQGFLHGSTVIAREKGIRGFFQGFVPSTAPQAANSMVRFTLYMTIKDQMEKTTETGMV